MALREGRVVTRWEEARGRPRLPFGMEWNREPFPEKVGQEGLRPIAWLLGGGGEERGL